MRIGLSDFPTYTKNLKNPLNPNEELLLIGIIRYTDYIGYTRLRRIKLHHEDIDSVPQGPDDHYTCVAYRRGNTAWVEIDDRESKQIPRPANFKVVPRLLMHIKNSE